MAEITQINPDGVEAEIRRISNESTQNLVILDHAHMRMDERDITIKQVINVLRLGERISKIEWDTESERGWKCKFRRVAAGRNVTVVAKLVMRDSETCLVVTTY